MADNKTVVPGGVSLSITRNDKTKTLVPFTFGKKSPHAGKQFFGPLFTVETLMDDITWAGITDLVDSLNRSYRRTFQDIWLDVLDDCTDKVKGSPTEGQVDWNKFWDQIQKDWVDFTAGVVKLSQIEDEIQELVDEQQALIASTPDSEEEVSAMMAKLKELSASIKPLKAKKEEISAKYADRAAKRKAKKDAEETRAAKLKAEQTASAGE